MTKQKLKAASFLAIAALAFTAGCNANYDHPVTAGGDASATTAITDDAASPSSESPLSQYFALLRGTETNAISDIQRNQIENEARIQELVAQCMRDAGFEFIINPPENNPIGFNPDLWRTFDPDWVAQYGFGIIVAPTETGTPLPGGQDAFTMEPNLEALEGLSEAKQSAWHQAYWGSGWESDDGCLHWALSQQHAETGFGYATANDEFAPLLEAMTELNWNLIEERHRSEWLQDWSHCMADAGIPGLEWLGAEQEAFRQHIHATLGQSWWTTYIDGPDLALTPQEAELRAQEIEWAFTNLDCFASVDFWGRDLAHRTEAEQQFVEDHRVALNALRDAIEQRGNVS